MTRPMSILDAFNKTKNQRFIDGFGLGEEYLKGVVYTEVIGNEVYQTVDNGVFRFSKSLSIPHSSTYNQKATVEELDKNNGRFELHIPKIPYKYYQMLIDWYRDVQKKEGTEACLVFFWNTNNLEIPTELFEQNKDGIIIDGQLIVYCPEQWNHGTVSKFAYEEYTSTGRTARLPDMFQWFETNTDMIMETHSHHTMGAFWSGEDDRNERGRKCRMYSVYGHITNSQPEHEIRIGMLGDFFTMRLEDIFELPFDRTVTITERMNNSQDMSAEGVRRSKNVDSQVTITVEEYGFDLEEIEEKVENIQGGGTLTTEITSNIPDYSMSYTTTNSPSISTYRYGLPVENVGESSQLRESEYPPTWWNMYSKLGGSVQNKPKSEFDSDIDLDEFTQGVIDGVNSSTEEPFDHMVEFHQTEIPLDERDERLTESKDNQTEEVSDEKVSTEDVII